MNVRCVPRPRPTRVSLIIRSSAAFQATTRPYTLRKGDTVDSIAQKRGMTAEQLLTFNADLNPDKIVEGVTIMLPSNKLSSRDKEILDGIGPGYRVYPVRAGETLDEIMGKRNISLEEMKSLNTGLDLSKALPGGQVLKLPANKYTVREREMLIGSGILPAEFFEATKNPYVIGFSVLMAVCGFVLAWQRFYKEEDDDE